jgi:hypothetical protein
MTMPEMEVYEARADAERAFLVANTESPFTIKVRFVGGLTDTQMAAFAAAADRWVKVIVGDLPEVEVDGEVVDDVLILVRRGAPGLRAGVARPMAVASAACGRDCGAVGRRTRNRHADCRGAPRLPGAAKPARARRASAG